jgi:MOSC domain-containing protein YiiM
MNNTGKLPAVSGVYVNDKHTFSKSSKAAIRLIKDFGVEGDCHAGPVDQHLFHLRRFGQHPNLRQVHLIHTELFDELALKGHAVRPGDLGENIATRNIELLKLPVGTRLRLGPEAIVELTGLRNPCRQIEAFQPGLLKHVLESTSAGLVRKAGVMSIVIQGGVVQPGDSIGVELPPLPHEPLVYRVPGLADRGEKLSHEPAQGQPGGQAHSVV